MRADKERLEKEKLNYINEMRKKSKVDIETKKKIRVPVSGSKNADFSRNTHVLAITRHGVKERNGMLQAVEKEKQKAQDAIEAKAKGERETIAAQARGARYLQHFLYYFALTIPLI